jgi:hypothetical protein
VVSASKLRAPGLLGLDLKTQARISRWHMALSKSLHSGPSDTMLRVAPRLFQIYSEVAMHAGLSDAEERKEVEHMVEEPTLALSV